MKLFWKIKLQLLPWKDIDNYLTHELIFVNRFNKNEYHWYIPRSEIEYCTKKKLINRYYLKVKERERRY